MGVHTHCNLTFFSKEKVKIKKISLDVRADDFIYNLVEDGGAKFKPEEFGDFSDEEKEIMKIYFDEVSASVMEGFASVTPNIQDPQKLLKIWINIRSGIITEFHNSMKKYYENLSLDSSIKMSEYDFDKKIHKYTWSLDCISAVISVLQVAIQKEHFVEITAADF